MTVARAPSQVDSSGVIDYRELNSLLREASAAAPSALPEPPQALRRNQKGAAPHKRGSALAGSSLALELDGELSVVEQLRKALQTNSMRVVDLFRDWDDNGDGLISKKEFRQAMPALGLNVDRSHADALFDSFDPDGSGTIEYHELNKLLRKQGPALAAELQAGAAGEIETSSSNKTKIRKTDVKARGSLAGLSSTALSAVDLSDLTPRSDGSRADGAGAATSVQGLLRKLLAKNWMRVSDLFRAWDTNGDGLVSRSEFVVAMRQLGVTAPAAAIDGLFCSFDTDMSGEVAGRPSPTFARLRRPSPAFAHLRPPSPAFAALRQPSPPFFALRRSTSTRWPRL